MKDRESLLPKDWFHRGDLDMRRAEILLENNDQSGAAFHLQQALEKYLKGYLISKGWKLERIHDLEDLLDYVVDYDKKDTLIELMISLKSMDVSIFSYFFDKNTEWEGISNEY